MLTDGGAVTQKPGLGLFFWWAGTVHRGGGGLRAGRARRLGPAARLRWGAES